PPRRRPAQDRSIDRALDVGIERTVEMLAGIAEREFAGNQMRELDHRAGPDAVSIRTKRLTRIAADVASVDLDGAENVELRRHRIVEPRMTGIDLAVAIALVDGRSVLCVRRAPLVGIHPRAA